MISSSRFDTCDTFLLRLSPRYAPKIFRLMETPAATPRPAFSLAAARRFEVRSRRHTFDAHTADFRRFRFRFLLRYLHDCAAMISSYFSPPPRFFCRYGFFFLRRRLPRRSSASPACRCSTSDTPCAALIICHLLRQPSPRQRASACRRQMSPFFLRRHISSD